MDSPAQPYVPVTLALLSGWIGPCHYQYIREWDLGVIREARATPDGLRIRLMTDHGLLWADDTSVRLDPTRPEVRHLIADRLNLGMEYRAGKWAVGMCWWAGVTGRALGDLFQSPTTMGLERTYRYGIHNWIEVGELYVSRHSYKAGWRIGVPTHERSPGDRNLAEGPETGDSGKAAANSAALAHDCALETPDGLLLPPTELGGAPILWSDHE